MRPPVIIPFDATTMNGRGPFSSSAFDAFAFFTIVAPG